MPLLYKRFNCVFIPFPMFEHHFTCGDDRSGSVRCRVCSCLRSSGRPDSSLQSAKMYGYAVRLMQMGLIKELSQHVPLILVFSFYHVPKQFEAVRKIPSPFILTPSLWLKLVVMGPSSLCPPSLSPTPTDDNANFEIHSGPLSAVSYRRLPSLHEPKSAGSRRPSPWDIMSDPRHDHTRGNRSGYEKNPAMNLDKVIVAKGPFPIFWYRKLHSRWRRIAQKAVTKQVSKRGVGRRMWVDCRSRQGFSAIWHLGDWEHGTWLSCLPHPPVFGSRNR